MLGGAGMLLEDTPISRQHAYHLSVMSVMLSMLLLQVKVMHCTILQFDTVPLQKLKVMFLATSHCLVTLR